MKKCAIWGASVLRLALYTIVTVYLFLAMRICLSGWIGAVLTVLLGASISYGFTSGGFIEISIIICGILACRKGNWVLGVTEILLACYLNSEYGWRNNLLW